ncbi:hypothetical protein JZ751_011492, partial [Albula glossodonta]
KLSFNMVKKVALTLKSSSVPKHGKRYTMYHGTSKQAATLIKKNGFKQSTGGMLGPGVYVSRDGKKAAHYPLNVPKDQKVVLKLTVRVGKVKKIDRQGHPLQKTWHQHGYDTAWVPPNCGMKLRLNMGKPRAPTLKSNSVPKHGRKYTMYHGTSTQNAQLIKKNGFRPSANGMLGPGVYMSRNVTKARMFPTGVLPNQKVVLKLRVNVGKVKKIDKHGHPLQKTWHQHGYNTAWVPPNCGMVPTGMEEDCVWNPKRIKIVKTIKPK